jgi:hypothetical protein
MDTQSSRVRPCILALAIAVLLWLPRRARADAPPDRCSLDYPCALPDDAGAGVCHDDGTCAPVGGC